MKPGKSIDVKRLASAGTCLVFVVLCCIASACTRCGPTPTGKGGAAVVATYASGKVTAEELQREANRLPPALREKFDTPDGRRELTSAMIDKRLLAGEARKRGLADDPEVRRQVEELEQRLTIQALLAAEEKQAGPPTIEELRAYYDAHQGELASPERARASRILVNVARGASEAERARARARLQALADRVRRGEPFEKVAEQGEGPERTRGGDLGFVLKGSLPDHKLSEAIFALGQPKAVSPVFDSADGYAVVQLVERTPARVPAFEEVRAEVANRLAPGRQRMVFEGLLARLRADAKVEFNAGSKQ